jgi:hypothetical protein
MAAPARFPTRRGPQPGMDPRHGPQPLGKRKMSVSVMETQVQWRGVRAEGRDPLRKLRSHLLFPRLSLYLTLPVQLRPFLGKQNIVDRDVDLHNPQARQALDPVYDVTAHGL